MIVETRKMSFGTEYWDTRKQKVLFVPTGENPDFEVTENPESIAIDTDSYDRLQAKIALKQQV